MMTMDMAEWIVIVDDNIADLKRIGHILSESGMRITALNSGQALLNYLAEEKHPDMLLLDIGIQDMSGFEVFRKIRKLEDEKGYSEIPTVFLSADDSSETEREGLALGAVDYIRKPCEPEILVHRVKNILNNSKRITALSEEASTDRLTGLLNKVSANKRLESACREYRGALLVIDMDHFKMVNDLYGHEAGDRVLTAFSEILRHQFRAHDIVGRIGGDEFIAFLQNISDAGAVKKIVRRLGEQLQTGALQILGENMTIPLGVSAGAVLSEGNGDFRTMFRKADKALYMVKQNGRHDCAVWNESEYDDLVGEKEDHTLDRMDMVLAERYVGQNAMWLGQEAFANVYRYMYRYIQRYHEKAYKVLFTISPKTDMAESDFEDVMVNLGEIIKNTLRNSDIMMQNVSNQFFLFLPMVSEDDIHKVIRRILNAWDQEEYSRNLKIAYETEAVVPEGEEKKPKKAEKDRGVGKTPTVIIVDDDVDVLKMAGSVLGEKGLRVTALNSGQALINYLDGGKRPELLLVDVNMPGIDGIETVKRLRDGESRGEKKGKGEIPVIFLSETDEEEELGLTMGALDYIKKPFIPNVLGMRVARAMEFIALRGRRQRGS